MYIPKAVKIGEVVVDGQTYHIRSPRHIVRKEKIKRLFKTENPSK